MLVTPPSRHGRRRSGSGYSVSARASPLPGYHRRASGPRSGAVAQAAAYLSPFVRRRTGSDGTCATCVAASSLDSCACSVDAGGPHPGQPQPAKPHPGGQHSGGPHQVGNNSQVGLSQENYSWWASPLWALLRQTEYRV